MLTSIELSAHEKAVLTGLAACGKHGEGRTLIEVIDDVDLWSAPFRSLQPIAPTETFERVARLAPTVVCAVAAEIGFSFQGVGTVFWGAFDTALGIKTGPHDRQAVGARFLQIADKYGLSRPSESAFSQHFSIMSWPLANALLPVDLVAPVGRLLARGPAQALPAKGRAPDLDALRAWASAVEGARLTDWLRIEEPALRVLVALATDNRETALSTRSYERIASSIRSQPEAISAIRSAQARRAAPRSRGQAGADRGRLNLSVEAGNNGMYVTWTPLAPAIFDDARATARAAGWRPALWGAGPRLHPDAALSAGPLRVVLEAPPRQDQHAYPDAALVFGEASDAAVALASRTINWEGCIIFDPDSARTRAEQRLEPLVGDQGCAWLAVSPDFPSLEGLLEVGTVCGYRIMEADLGSESDRGVLIAAGLLDAKPRMRIARHPIDAMIASRGAISPFRPFLVMNGRTGMDAGGEVRTLSTGTYTVTLDGSEGADWIRIEPMQVNAAPAVEFECLERDMAFDALMAKRIQIRIESRIPLTNVCCRAELDVNGTCIASSSEVFASVPATVMGASKLLRPIYEETVRDCLLAAGRGVLTLSVGKSAAVRIELERPAASVEWNGTNPSLVDDLREHRLSSALASAPHQFADVASVVAPAHGASASGIIMAGNRVAHPLLVLASTSIGLGDLTARFGEDAGSRLLFDGGGGVAEIARARVAWGRGRCDTLLAVGARARVVAQFEGVMALALCGAEWRRREEAGATSASDPYIALWQTALACGLATVPDEATPSEVAVFADCFAKQLRLRDPDWPTSGVEPIEGAMDDALNAAFEEALAVLNGKGLLMSTDADDFDFGSPHENWSAASNHTINMVGRGDLVELMAPSEGARVLRLRSYAGTGLAELADGLSDWTRRFALPRGRLTRETAVNALQLWLSPGACGDADDAVRVSARDPFVARAIRYAALRLLPFLH